MCDSFLGEGEEGVSAIGELNYFLLSVTHLLTSNTIIPTLHL